MLNTISMADSYFATNAFGSDVWGALTDERKTTLLTTAENDVNAYLGTTDAAEAINAVAPFTVYQMAVFEWALYIEKIKNYSKPCWSDQPAAYLLLKLIILAERSMSPHRTTAEHQAQPICRPLNTPVLASFLQRSLNH